MNPSGRSANQILQTSARKGESSSGSGEAFQANFALRQVLVDRLGEYKLTAWRKDDFHAALTDCLQ